MSEYKKEDSVVNVLSLTNSQTQHDYPIDDEKKEHFGEPRSVRFFFPSSFLHRRLL